MKIAQISDLHLTADGQPLYGRVDTETAWRQALSRALALGPDWLVLTGDLAEGGHKSAYRRLRDSLADCPCPYALLPGNHDDRAALREVFADQPWSPGDLCSQRREGDGGWLLLLDVTIPGCDGGEFGSEQESWLGRQLARGWPSLLFMHQPPFAVGIEYMDRIRCRGEDALRRLLAEYPQQQVEALLCGHIHRAVSTTFAGHPALVAPSPAHQIDIEPGPLAWTPEPGGFLWHDWRPGERLLSHLVPVLAAEKFPYV
ncbi:MAG: phosphodiesterase [Betaproteobacteria bacterium]